MLKIKVFFVLYWIILSVQAVEPLQLDGKTDYYSTTLLNAHLEILPDPNKQWQIQDIASTDLKQQFSPFTQQNLRHFYRDSSVWLRLRVDNPSKQNLYYILRLFYMERISFYLPNKQGGFQHYQAGARALAQQMEFLHHLPIVSVNLPAKTQQTIYIQVHDRMFQLRYLEPQLWSFTAFWQYNTLLLLRLGIFLGLVFALMLYHFFLFLSMRDMSNLYYSLYLLSIVVLSLILDNLLIYFKLNLTFDWLNGLIIGLASLFIFLLQFSRYFFETINCPLLDKLIQLHLLGFALSITSLLVIDVYYVVLVVEYLILLSILLLITVSFYRWQQNYPAIVYFFIAIMAMPLLFLAYILPDMIPIRQQWLFFNIELFYFFATLAITFWAFAVANKIYQLQQSYQKNLQQAVHRRTEELLHSNQILRSKNEQLDTFARTVAHDLKNPLCAMNNFVDIVLNYHKDNLNQQQCNYLQQTLKTGHYMLSAVDNLLLLARISRQTITLERLDMHTIVLQAWQQIALLCEELNGEIILPEADEWPVSYGYTPWVLEIWVNYLSNGLKYGGLPPVLRVLAIADKNQHSIRFEVRDNGVGLSAQQQAQLFQPFIRLHPKRCQGQGLGLSIVASIVEKLGAKAGVNSQLGQGSVFYFTLPAHLDE